MEPRKASIVKHKIDKTLNLKVNNKSMNSIIYGKFMYV